MHFFSDGVWLIALLAARIARASASPAASGDEDRDVAALIASTASDVGQLATASLSAASLAAAATTLGANRARDEYVKSPATRDWAVQSRDLKDWQLSDISLAATLDGSLHALDRDQGTVRWSISSADATLQTQQHPSLNLSSTDADPDVDTWIVEPIEDGGLYVFNRRDGLQRLPFGVKQLVENSPFTVPGDSKVYVGERKTTLFSIDPRNGNVLGAYGTGFGHQQVQPQKCPARDALDELDEETSAGCFAADPGANTVLRMGRNTYTLTIFEGNRTLWNVTYAEWVPNTADVDLRRQYATTFDGRYISPLHDGRLIAHDALTKEALWYHEFDSPALRIYDVLHQYDSQRSRRGAMREADLTGVAIVPQPVDEQLLTTKDGRHPADRDDATFIGMSGSGDWFAMSMSKCPLVIGAPRCKWSVDSAFVRPEDIMGIHLHNRVSIQPGRSPGHPLTIDGATLDDTKLIDGGSDVNDSSISRADTIKQAASNQTFWLWLYALSTTLFALYVAWRQFGGSALIGRLKSTPIPEVIAPQVRFVEDVVVDAKPVEQSETVIDAEPVDVPEKLKPKRKRGSRGGKKLREQKAQAALMERSRSDSTSDDKTNDNESDSNDPSLAIEDGDQPIKISGEDQTTTLQVEPLPAVTQGPLQLNSLTVTDQILGYGSHGTVVFRGTFGRRDVAVKRMLLDFYDIASHEVELLEQSDDHPNVIRYYCKQENERFLYIALELCEASLAETTERPRDYPDLAQHLDDPISILRQMALGVQSLHSLKIVHRDLKPQNILVNPPLKTVVPSKQVEASARVVISDFGLCKRLDADQSSFRATTAQAAGTSGWRAPELLIDESAAAAVARPPAQIESTELSNSTPTNGGAGVPRKVSRAIDIFSLGCLFYYVLSRGQHPFGDRYMREANIIKAEHDLSVLDLHGEVGVLARDLITSMIAPDPKARPDAAAVLRHPLFWTAERQLAFLLDLSDRLDVEVRDPPSPLLVALESRSKEVVYNNWHARLDRHLLENLGKYRKYQSGSILDLLRALRNKKHHYQDLPPTVVLALGRLPDGFLAYFTRRFPNLLLHTWAVAGKHLRAEPLFRSYFDG